MYNVWEISSYARKASGEPKADFGGPMFAMLEADKSRTDKAKTVALAAPEPQSKGAQVHELVNQKFHFAHL